MEHDDSVLSYHLLPPAQGRVWCQEMEVKWDSEGWEVVPYKQLMTVPTPGAISSFTLVHMSPSFQASAFHSFC